jgi:ribosomal protein S18 acetylase RimI-like enzyme
MLREDEYYFIERNDFLENKSLEAQEITTREELIKFLEASFTNMGHHSVDTDFIIDRADWILKEKRDIYFFGVKRKEEIIATCSLELKKEQNERYGEVSFASVNREQRDKGLVKKVMDKMEESAREKECSYLELKVLCDNFSAINAYLKNDYNIESIDGMGFVMRKHFKEKSEVGKEDVGELREVSLNDLRVIRELLESGWRGIDIKNTESVKSKNPKDWKLILEK